MGKLDDPNASPDDPVLKVLDKSITAVPAVRYALGIAGVGAASALVLTFFESVPTAILGVAFLLVAMILLRVFARLAASTAGDLRILALVLAWCFVVLFCGFGALTTTCVFFDKPKPYPVLVKTLIAPSSISTEGRTARVNEAPRAAPVDIQIKQLTKLADLPPTIRTPADENLPKEQLRETLRSKGSLTIDGTLLVVGEIGDGSSSTLSVDSLNLVNGARVVTNGNTLNIQANRINASGGGIVSFFPPDVTPLDATSGSPGIDGASGGKVFILTSEALSSVLKVDLRGEIGGRGGPGAAGAAGLAGARGRDGVDHLFDCASGGTDGTAGSPGEQGKTGLPGGNGGAGGSLYIVRNLTTAKIDFSARGGIGGAGGPGGPGGPGGTGGEGGSGSFHCHGGHRGSDGPNGLPGNSGPRGQPGKDNTEIVRL